ncbi:MAG: hypothetical protein U1E14_07650 [Geminicoccaceae bacterium]
MRQAAPLLGLLPALLLAACELPEAPRGDTTATAARGDRPSVRFASGVEGTAPLDKQQAIERIGNALRQRGFTITRADPNTGLLDAVNRTGSDAAWASCARLAFRDPMAEAFRSRSSDASGFESRVSVLASPQGKEVRVTVRASFLGQYINGFTFATETAPCRSTGALEDIVLAALRG